jgi:hypothetical protein
MAGGKYLSQSAQFKKNDPRLREDGLICIDCPQRTGRDTTLFADIKNSDTCMLCGIIIKPRIPILRFYLQAGFHPRKSFLWRFDNDVRSVPSPG